MPRAGFESAATNLRAGGMDEADCMKVGGWKTAHVFTHYDLGNIDGLRDRLTRARKKAATISRVDGTRRQRVAPGRVGGFLHSSCTADSCER
jgi:hypothetical protein